MDIHEVGKINNLQEIEKIIAANREFGEALEKRKQILAEKADPLRHLEKECWKITWHLDDWIKKMLPPHSRDFPLYILFLGACSGEWAARTHYRGSLPGLGGFMIVADGEYILVDPGRSSFNHLLTQRFHPKFLTSVVATHRHWDSVRDLNPILMAGCPVIKENWRDTDDKLRLYADRSVLYGLEMDADEVIQSSGDYGYFEELDKNTLEDFKPSMSKFSHSVPGVLTAYDLFFRLGGRFKQIEINRKYKISDNVDLYTRPSFHPVGHAVESIPALDFVVRQNGEPRARCVYLSDTEYRRELAEIYSKDLDKLGPVDVLICNVKTLNVFEKPAGDPYEGFTWKHLGWKGLLQLTEDFRNMEIILPRSLVVLRAWGIETVTHLDEQDGALVAAPEKLSVYEEEYQKNFDQKAVIPNITWVHVKDRQSPISVEHIRPPFQKKEGYRQFGKIFFVSQSMADVVRSAKAATDNQTVTVLITGESGVGKDELAKAIHKEAVFSSGRSDHLIIRSAASLDPSLAESFLFGFDKGGFTGAEKDTPGWLEEAKDGTLLIQEVAAMLNQVQKKLLTFLEERKYQRIGGPKTFDLKAQMIFTTDANLKEKAEKEEFSKQLLQRFKRYIEIPPLRERVEDIPCIIEGLRRDENYAKMPSFNNDVISLLQEYTWPGNVRQLIRVLDQVIETNDFSLDNIRKIVDNDHKLFTKQDRKESRPKKVGFYLDDDLKSILAVLKDGKPRRKKDILQELGNPKPSLSALQNRLNALIKNDLIQALGEGRKRLYVVSKKPGHESFPEQSPVSLL